MFKKIIDFIKKYDLLVSTIVIILICMGSYSIMIRGGQKASEKFSDKTNYFTLNDTIIKGQKTVYIYDNINQLSVIVQPIKYNDTYTFNRILSQLNTIKYRAMAHNKAIDYFIIHLYYFITIQIIFMIIVVILGAIISKKGWGDSSSKLLITFVIACGFLLFFQIFPKGMMMDSNLKQNKSNYKLYCAVENDVLTYLTTSEVDDNFVKDLDLLLKQNHAISFDLEEVPFATVKNQFDEIRKSSESSSSSRRDRTQPKVIYLPVYKDLPTSIVKDTTIKK